MWGIGSGAAVSFVCAAAAAGGNALANMMQPKASFQQQVRRPLGAAVLRDLLRRTTWLLGFAGMVASFLLQAVALRFGQLSAVETVITLEVPLTLLVASHVFPRRARSGGRWRGCW